MTRDVLASNNTEKTSGAGSDTNILVPVTSSPTMRETVHHAAKQVVSSLSPEQRGTLYFVVIAPTLKKGNDNLTVQETLLDRARIWAGEELGEYGSQVEVRTGIIGQDSYVFSPSDVARILHGTATAKDIDRIVLDPGFDAGIDMPLLRPLEQELEHCTHVTCEKAPITRNIHQTPISSVYSIRGFLVTFGITFVFYHLLAGTVTGYSLATGGVTALAAASVFSRLLFTTDPTRLTPVRFLRFIAYLPFLITEIIRANLRVAALILHPQLPIDPRMVTITPRIDGSLPLTLLATSITLTPGTLTTRIDGRELLVHTLDQESRNGLYDGGFEQRISNIFRETLPLPDTERSVTAVPQGGGTE